MSSAAQLAARTCTGVEASWVAGAYAGLALPGDGVAGPTLPTRTLVVAMLSKSEALL